MGAIMSIKQTLEDFFKNYKKLITIEDIIKKLKIPKEKINILLDNLFELEKEGKIYYFNNSAYMHIPDEFYHHFGILKKSNSNQYYIKSKENNILLIKNLKGAKVGDSIYVSITNEKTNHPKQFNAKIERIVKRENLNDNHNYIIKEVLKKDGSHYYINLKEQRIYIPKENLNTAFAGDTVNVQITNNVGSVIEVLKRNKKNHVFKCIKIDNELLWTPISSSYGYYHLENNKFKEGDTILAEIKSNALKLIQKIENNNTIQDEINTLVIEYGFNKKFSKQVLEEAKKIKTTITKEDLENRIDLRNLETFSIDPIDAKDLDDAVSLEIKDNNYILYVHAANPSHYIKMGSQLFVEALKRGFSVYPNNSVIPMLPNELSSDICSLNESGDKLALTIRLVIDKNGPVKYSNIFKSIIRSNKQMNYDDANIFLKTLDPTHPYAPFKNTLLKMRELATILQNNKTQRGSITFESEEKQFIFDEEGKIIDIKEKQRGESQLIIENFMLLANESISKYALYLDLPFIYRNHEQPTIQKKITLRQNLHQKGYLIQKIRNADNPEYLQSVLTSLLKGKSKEEKKMICELFLKSMTRAFYDSKNTGHYGLALDCYGTFTSPARKISDLINHMIIEEFIDNGIQSKKLDIYREFIDKSCEYISEKQKSADLLEQEMNSIMLSKYAENFIDTEVKARILFINHYGIYVKDTHGLTGVIPIDKNMKLINQKVLFQGKEYKKEDQITVKLKERKNDELIFTIPIEETKKLVKKKTE